MEAEIQQGIKVAKVVDNPLLARHAPPPARSNVIYQLEIRSSEPPPSLPAAGRPESDGVAISQEDIGIQAAATAPAPLHRQRAGHSNPSPRPSPKMKAAPRAAVHAPRKTNPAAAADDSDNRLTFIVISGSAFFAVLLVSLIVYLMASGNSPQEAISVSNAKIAASSLAQPEPQPQPQPEPALAIPVSSSGSPSHMPVPGSDSASPAPSAIEAASVPATPARAEVKAPVKKPDPIPPRPSAGLVDVNTASKEELESVSGIGPVLAQKIIDSRPYRNLSDLKRIYGIGDKKLEFFSRHLTAGNAVQCHK